MDKKAFFEMIRDEVNAAISKVSEKVEEVSKVSSLKIKNHNLKNQIKDLKGQIGELVVNNRDDFTHIPEIKSFLDKIAEIEEDIEKNNTEIKDLQEAEEKENSEKDS